MEQRQPDAPAAMDARPMQWLALMLVILLLAGLPLAVWLDLRYISETALRHQAADLNAMLTSIRGYYGENVVGRVMSAPGPTRVTHDYESIPGAIPIPATLSIELAGVIRQRQDGIAYRFVSDYPFKNRARHVLDDFETRSLQALRAQPNQQLTEVSWSGLTARVRQIAPVIMGAACLDCHDANPQSPKHDWKVGDVRGIQEVSISQPVATHVFSFKYLLIYFVFIGASGFSFVAMQKRQAAALRGLNLELGRANAFLESVSTKLSRYLSPQIYKSIFSGDKDVTIHTERKKLTIFFSDIKDFTATTERLQPEVITSLLNEYFTEMSGIALRHGGTIDKFVGDAMLIFFGDPESKGVAEDARACVRMAIDMQRRLAELNIKWRAEGIERPFRVRMGINTGFCNVGNFGSSVRMDYTIIGDEANLAARLQSIANVESIVISYETYALVRDIVSVRALPPMSLKGIGRDVAAYVVEGLLDHAGKEVQVFSEHDAGLAFYLDLNAIGTEAAEHARTVLRDALTALEQCGRASNNT